MFGLGIWELALIAVVALVVLGPRRLPEVARQVGKALNEFRRATNSLKAGFEEEESGKGNGSGNVPEGATKGPDDHV